jgi:WD40-like Beta Propeller Repeat
LRCRLPAGPLDGTTLSRTCNISSFSVEQLLVSIVAWNSNLRCVPGYCPLLTCFFLLSAAGASQNRGRLVNSGYAPAYYSGTQTELPRVVAFPPVGKPIIIPLPLPGLLRFPAFAQSGRQIFATINTIQAPRTPGHPARMGFPRLLRIDFRPVRVTTVADLAGLADVLGLVVTASQDRILFAGTGWKGKLGCDLFEINSSGENMKMLLPDFGCMVGGLSPDGDKMLVPRGIGLDIVDLATGASKSLGNEFWKGAWSPDGKWIAALQIDPVSTQPRRPRLSRTVRIDAGNLSQRRVMGGGSDSEIVWSPDSRYLLYSEWRPPCPNGDENPSLIAMDIESGAREIVSESRCKVNGNRYVGWISLDALREAR